MLFYCSHFQVLHGSFLLGFLNLLPKRTVLFYHICMYRTFTDMKRFCRAAHRGVILYHIQPQRNRPFLRQPFQSNPSLRMRLPQRGNPSCHIICRESSQIYPQKTDLPKRTVFCRVVCLWYVLGADLLIGLASCYDEEEKKRMVKMEHPSVVDLYVRGIRISRKLP